MAVVRVRFFVSQDSGWDQKGGGAGGGAKGIYDEIGHLVCVVGVAANGDSSK